MSTRPGGRRSDLGPRQWCCRKSWFPIGRKTSRIRDEARAEVFDFIERFYNAKRRHSRIGYLIMSPMEFERQAGFQYCS